mmetsp:Transcript_204/g.472  ORF Transcript_204/g.472 Transcript_204/m.472 type:complete len:318 (+) Transcript_204:405-1358(+)
MLPSLLLKPVCFLGAGGAKLFSSRSHQLAGIQPSPCSAPAMAPTSCAVTGALPPNVAATVTAWRGCSQLVHSAQRATAAASVPTVAWSCSVSLLCTCTRLCHDLLLYSCAQLVTAPSWNRLPCSILRRACMSCVRATPCRYDSSCSGVAACPSPCAVPQLPPMSHWIAAATTRAPSTPSGWECDMRHASSTAASSSCSGASRYAITSGGMRTAAPKSAGPNGSRSGRSDAVEVASASELARYSRARRGSAATGALPVRSACSSSSAYGVYLRASGSQYSAICAAWCAASHVAAATRLCAMASSCSYSPVTPPLGTGF